MSNPFQIIHVIQNGDDLNSIAKQYQTNMQDIVSANQGVNFYNLYVGDSLNVMPGDGYRVKLHAPGAKNVTMSFAKVALRDEMRKLWEQHNAWTMRVIVSILSSLPDEQAVTRRLLRNPVDFEKLFSHYYGESVGRKIKELLTDHLVIAANLIKALKAGDATKAAEENRKWFINADEIAKALASINPNWKQQDMKNMFDKHLNLLNQAVSRRMQGNYVAEIQALDLNELHSLEMADALSNGIWKQSHGRV